MKAVCYRGNEISEEPVRELTGDSLLASVEFASVWETRGGKRVVWVVEDAGQAVGVMPGVEFGKWPVRRFMAMPNGLYGRLFGSVGAEAESVGACLLKGIAEAGYVKTYLFDFYGTLHYSTEGSFEVRRETALLVDISRPDWAPSDRKLRGEIRKAEREGLRVARFAWDEHGIGFMGLVGGMVKEHGGEERYDEAFWRRLAQVAMGDERVVWYYATYGDRPVSSQVYFVEGDMLIGWQMYYDREFSSLKANACLINRACEEGRARGVRTLDLGATPEGAEGTEFFKRRWGGCEYEYRALTLLRGIGRLV